MKKTELIIITFISIVLGTSMHFVHHVPFFNNLMACIFPVNECVWEHMKMLFYPMLLTSVYLCVRQRSIDAFGGMIASSLVCIPTQIALFYVYWIFTRHAVTIVDVLAYVIVMVFGYYLGNKFTANKWIRQHSTLFIVIAVCMVALLAVLTFHHPEINLFIPEEE